MKVKATLCIATIAAAGCASNPDDIQATYVSPMQYSSYSCEQIAQEMGHLERRTNELYQNLKAERTADNWQMGVGLVLFWPALFALEGGDGPEATEYAQIKGEYEALRVNSVEKNCNLQMRTPDEMLEAARTSDESDNAIPAATPTTEATREERLRELQSLREQELITEEEYQEARRSVLGL